MAKAYSNMASDMIKKTYYQLNKLDHLFNRLYAKYVWEELNKELNVEVMQYEEEDICFLIMQQILDDGRKALKICGDPVTSFKSIPDTKCDHRHVVGFCSLKGGNYEKTDEEGRGGPDLGGICIRDDAGFNRLR